MKIELLPLKWPATRIPLLGANNGLKNNPLSKINIFNLPMEPLVSKPTTKKKFNTAIFTFLSPSTTVSHSSTRPSTPQHKSSTFQQNNYWIKFRRWSLQPKPGMQKKPLSTRLPTKRWRSWWRRSIGIQSVMNNFLISKLPCGNLRNF